MNPMKRTTTAIYNNRLLLRLSQKNATSLFFLHTRMENCELPACSAHSLDYTINVEMSFFAYRSSIEFIATRDLFQLRG
jgi:hypothetical protein